MYIFPSCASAVVAILAFIASTTPTTPRNIVTGGTILLSGSNNTTRTTTNLPDRVSLLDKREDTIGIAWLADEKKKHQQYCEPFKVQKSKSSTSPIPFRDQFKPASYDDCNKLWDQLNHNRIGAYRFPETHNFTFFAILETYKDGNCVIAARAAKALDRNKDRGWYLGSQDVLDALGLALKRLKGEDGKTPGAVQGDINCNANTADSRYRVWSEKEELLAKWIVTGTTEEVYAPFPGYYDSPPAPT